jgi:competence protein ComEC
MAALLAADIEAPVERILLERSHDALRAQVLMVAHHGSRTSSTEPFIDAVSPSIAIFQVGYLNRFHHPNAGVYARYRLRDIALSRSDWDGATRVEVPAASSSQATLDMADYRTVHRRYWMDMPP